MALRCFKDRAFRCRGAQQNRSVSVFVPRLTTQVWGLYSLVEVLTVMSPNLNHTRPYGQLRYASCRLMKRTSSTVWSGGLVAEKVLVIIWGIAHTHSLNITHTHSLTHSVSLSHTQSLFLFLSQTLSRSHTLFLSLACGTAGSGARGVIVSLGVFESLLDHSYLPPPTSSELFRRSGEGRFPLNTKLSEFSIQEKSPLSRRGK